MSLHCQKKKKVEKNYYCTNSIEKLWSISLGEDWDRQGTISARRQLGKWGQDKDQNSLFASSVKSFSRPWAIEIIFRRKSWKWVKLDRKNPWVDLEIWHGITLIRKGQHTLNIAWSWGMNRCSCLWCGTRCYHQIYISISAENLPLKITRFQAFWEQGSA